MLKKLKDISPLSALFGILVFYLPLQYCYTKPLAHLAEKWYGACSFIPQQFERTLTFYITDILMLAILTLCVGSWRRWIKEQPLLLLFLAVSFLSVLLSKCSGFAWTYYHWLQLALPIFVCIALTSKIETRHFFKIFCWVLVATSIIQCVVAISEYVLQHTLGLRYLGEMNIDSRYSSSFFMLDKSRWIFDKIFHTSAPLQTILRVTGTLPHPNILGGFMGVAALATSFLYLQRKKGQVALGLLLFFQVFVIFITYSRAALFGWMGASAILIWLMRTDRSAKWLALLLTTATLLSGAILYDQLAHRGGVVNYNATARESDASRLIYQDMAMKMANDRLWFGVGWDQFLFYSGDLAPQQLPRAFMFQTVHNIYFLLLSQTGLLGLLTFLGFIGWTLWSHLKHVTPESAALIAILLFLLAVGLCDHYVLTGQHGRLLFFLSTALLCAQKVGKRALRLG